MKKVVFLALFLSTQSVLAVGPECQTKVLKTRVSNTGGLYLSADNISNGTFVLLCGVNQAVGGVGVDTCKSWLSILQVAQASSKNIDISYKYADDSITSCASIPAGSNAPTPYFVQLAN
ncbi:MAG: hypothetical protein ACRBCI_11955 [Cellvibrionaceae bacterium]